MKIFFSIIFILLLSLITLHDAHSNDKMLIGFDQTAAYSLNDPVVKVRTTDGALFDVQQLKKTAVGLAKMNTIPTAQGSELIGSEIKTYFYTGKPIHPPINKKVPSIDF